MGVSPHPHRPSALWLTVGGARQLSGCQSSCWRWLLRIEDLDPPREDPHASASILRTLDAYGLHHDGEVRYQSLQNARYQERLDQLIAQDLAFPPMLTHSACRPGAFRALPQQLGRMRMALLSSKERWCFDDRIQGRHCEELRLLGDFVLKRRDGPGPTSSPWSAMILTKASPIVRGIDLIDSTARQAQLYQALQQPYPATRTFLWRWKATAKNSASKTSRARYRCTILKTRSLPHSFGSNKPTS